MEERIKVLYVDDETSLLDIARHFLEKTGNFLVSTSTSAQDALGPSKIPSYDVIISDYQMPGMDGIAFLKEVRNRYGDIPFILFTGRGREEIVIEAINNGADFYLQKGGDTSAQFAELAHMIQRAVLRKRAELSRVNAETALRDSEERLQLLIRYAPAALAMFDRDMHYLAASCRWLADYHLGDQDIIGRSHYEIFPEISEDIKAVHRRGLSGEIVSADEEKFERHDGSVQWVSWEMRPWHATDRSIGGIILFSEDITRRKNAEEELRKSEERLHLAIDASSDGLFDWDMERDDAYFSPRYFTMLGYAPGELPATMSTLTRLLHPDDRDKTLSVVSEYQEGTRENHSVEFRLREKDGNWKWIMSRGKITGRNAEGKPVRMVGTHTDITERKHVEEALRESEEKYRSLVEKANEAITIIQDGHHVYVNSRMAELVGIPANDLTGTSFLDMAWPGDREMLRARYAQRCAGEKVPETYDFRMTGPGGKPRWIYLSVAKIQWQGRPATLNMMTDITDRKLAEAALRESERNYRNLVENSQSIIFMMLPDGTITFVSPSWKARLGHAPSEIIGRNFRTIVLGEDVPKAEAFLKRAVEAGELQVSSTDYRVIHKDGSIRWHSSSVMPVFDERNNLVSFVGNAVDFTDRKHVEDALQESRAELRSILHGSPVLQFVIGRDHRILSWNKALEAYSGIPAAEVIGTDQQWRAFFPHQRPVLADLLVDNNKDGLLKLYGGKLQPSRYVDGAYEVTDFFPSMGASGTHLSYTAAPIRNADGEIIGAVETLEDVTERVNAIEALRASEGKYRHILENMQDAYIRTDVDGTITMANPSAVRMYGYDSVEEMLGIPVVCLYATEHRKGNMIRKLTENGGITDFSGEALKKDGTIFWVSLNIQYIKDKDGRIRGTEAIVRDITERRVMERAVQEANRKLALLSSITRHDIANQLTILQGFAQLAAVKERDPVIAGYLTKIDAGTVTIRRQIEFTKAYQDLGVHTPGWILLEKTVAKAARSEVDFSGTCKDIEVFADPMLEKVFFNLFENALRHGGHVTEIGVRCERNPDNLLILIEDNGTGIPADEKEIIFEKGFGKNTGLGLFLAREILAITGITIRETGTPGKGAKFEIAVPKGQFRSV